MKKIVSLLVISIFILIYSCTENNPNSPFYDPPPPVEWSDYFPLKVGAYWIYENYDTDSNYVRLNNSPTYDTILVDKIMTVEGKECFKVLTKPGTIDCYYYGEDSKLFQLQSAILYSARKWMLYNDFNNYKDTIIEDWKYRETTSNPFKGYQAWNKNYRIKDTVLNFNDNNYNAMGFYHYFSSNFWSEYFYNHRGRIILAYYIKDIGLGYSRTEYITNDVDLGGFYSNYAEKILIKYYIPK